MCPSLQVSRCLASPVQVISVSFNPPIKVPAFAALVPAGMEAKRPRLAFSLQKKQALQSRIFGPFYFMLEWSPSGIRDILFLRRSLKRSKPVWAGECLQGLCRWRRGSCRPNRWAWWIIYHYLTHMSTSHHVGPNHSRWIPVVVQSGVWFVPLAYCIIFTMLRMSYVPSCVGWWKIWKPSCRF